MEQAKQVFEISTKIAFWLLTMLMGVVAWQGQSALKRIEQNSENIAALQNRVVAIESNRYTSSDAVRDQREFAQGIRELRIWIEANYPPDWLQDDVREIKADIRKMRESK